MGKLLSTLPVLLEAKGCAGVDWNGSFSCDRPGVEFRSVDNALACAWSGADFQVGKLAAHDVLNFLVIHLLMLQVQTDVAEPYSVCSRGR